MSSNSWWDTWLLLLYSSLFQLVSERALDILSEIISELCKMEGMESEGSVTRPPLLDGKNYSYWKSRMISFLKSLEHKAWKSVLTG